MDESEDRKGSGQTEHLSAKERTMLNAPEKAASSPKSRQAKQLAGAKGGKASAISRKRGQSTHSEENRRTTARPESRIKKQRAASKSGR